MFSVRGHQFVWHCDVSQALIIPGTSMDTMEREGWWEPGSATILRVWGRKGKSEILMTQSHTLDTLGSDCEKLFVVMADFLQSASDDHCLKPEMPASLKIAWSIPACWIVSSEVQHSTILQSGTAVWEKTLLIKMSKDGCKKDTIQVMSYNACSNNWEIILFYTIQLLKDFHSKQADPPSDAGPCVRSNSFTALDVREKQSKPSIIDNIPSAFDLSFYSISSTDGWSKTPNDTSTKYVVGAERCHNTFTCGHILKFRYCTVLKYVFSLNTYIYFFLVFNMFLEDLSLPSPCPI